MLYFAKKSTRGKFPVMNFDIIISDWNGLLVLKEGTVIFQNCWMVDATLIQLSFFILFAMWICRDAFEYFFKVDYRFESNASKQNSRKKEKRYLLGPTTPPWEYQ